MRSLKIQVTDEQEISALLTTPSDPIACYVMAHGAGAGMTHPFMAAFAAGLAERRIATLRYQFTFVENGSKRPDLPPVAHAAVRATVATALKQLSSVPLFAGGKSFGGRMTSQAQAAAALPGVMGLGFAGFPLHPAGKPSIDRARHFSDITVPMLFLQGTRDTLADLGLIETTVSELGPLATLKIIDGADHSFHVPARTGRTDAQVLDEMLDALSAWIQIVVAKQEKASPV